MLIKNDFEVPAPVEQVWKSFDDIAGIAECLPGTRLTEDLGNDEYKGVVAVKMGPVSLQFGGEAAIKERDNTARRIVVDAKGAETKGKGTAAMLVTAGLTRSPGGTKVNVSMDLQISGAAAQYGRGMIGDVTAVLMRQFADNLSAKLTGDPKAANKAKAASGFALGVQAALMALRRVFRRFFVPGVG